MAWGGNGPGWGRVWSGGGAGVAHCSSFHVGEWVRREDESDISMITQVPNSAAHEGRKTSHQGMPASGSPVNCVMLANGMGWPSLAWWGLG